MDHEYAARIAKSLARRWDPSGRGAVVGSIRRLVRQPRDIDLLLPCADNVEGPDPVYEAMRRNVWVEPDPQLDLLEAPAERTDTQHFDVVQGFKPHFLRCTLSCEPFQRPGWPEGLEPFQLEVYRYVPGKQGNFGWASILRTGPAEFSRAIVGWVNRRAWASVGGFLRDTMGNRIATPTEESAFRRLHLRYVPPEQRVNRASLVTVHARRRTAS